MRPDSRRRKARADCFFKNSHRFGRSLSEAVKYDYSHVVECVLNTGDSFRATSGLLLMDMWGDWITVLRSEGIPLFSYDFLEDSKQAKDFLFIEKVNFLPLPEIIFRLYDRIKKQFCIFHSNLS